MSNKASSSVAIAAAVAHGTMSTASVSAVPSESLELMKPTYQDRGALSTVTKVATTIREAVGSSFTVSSTQLMTVQIPGTIIDPNQFCWNEAKDSIKPLSVRIEEARLVDNQIPISKVMIDHTGKSVARSYVAALGCLVSVETSVSSGDDRVLTERQSEIRDRYTQAMNYLTTSDCSVSGKSRLQTYVEKQESWNQAVERYNEAQTRHRQTIKEKGLAAQQQEYSFLEWLKQDGRDYKAAIQAKYMDWVVYGNKFTVEFNFGVVDLTSAMKRVESSKEAFKNLTLLATDGVTEHNSVNLMPPNWASLVQQKMDEWQKFNNVPSIIELHTEIKRLHHILISHQGLYDAIESGKFIPHQFSEFEDEASITLRGHYEQAYANADANKWAKEQVSAKKDVEELIAEGGKILTGVNKVSTGKDSKTVVQKEDKPSSASAGNIELNMKTSINPFDAINAEADTWNKAFTTHKAGTMQAIDDEGKEKTQNHIRERIENVRRQIEMLESKLKSMGSELVSLPNTIIMPEVYANGKAVDDHELIANKNLLEDSMVKDPSPWTRITTKVAVSEFDSLKAASQSSMSENFCVGWGFWSMGISESNSYPKDEPAPVMDDLEVEVSMDCMVVDIDRPWLHAELFADHQLNAAPGFTISPGREILREAVEQDVPTEIAQGQFCSYPNAFVVASNVELEFKGNTAWLESGLKASATEARASIGWGPFILGSSSNKSSISNSQTRVHNTETGVRISLQAPQIIAWIQELLPALPKRAADDMGFSAMSLAEFSD